ncbi:MAG: cytidylyltransferase domain-containing protein [Promethearchaeota archaeon]
MKVAAIIQARQGSSRLPGKTLIDIVGKPALQRVIERIWSAKLIDDVIVATTINKEDNAIVELCKSLGTNYFRGSEDDVLDRVLNAAKKFDVDVIVEITADCPLIDYNHIDKLIDWHLVNDADMTTNILERTFPRGYDIRIFDTKTLERVNEEVNNNVDRQHVSTWMYLNPKGKQNYSIQNWTAPPEQNRSDIEITLDTPEDLELIRWIYGFEKQGYNIELTCQNVINLIDTYPMMYEKVKNIQRKDYFEELNKSYKFIKKLENNILYGDGKEEVPKGIFKGSDIKNENVQRTDNRSRQTSKRGRPPKQR